MGFIGVWFAIPLGAQQLPQMKTVVGLTYYTDSAVTNLPTSVGLTGWAPMLIQNQSLQGIESKVPGGESRGAQDAPSTIKATQRFVFDRVNPGLLAAHWELNREWHLPEIISKSPRVVACEGYAQMEGRLTFTAETPLHVRVVYENPFEETRIRDKAWVVGTQLGASFQLQGSANLVVLPSGEYPVSPGLTDTLEIQSDGTVLYRRGDTFVLEKDYLIPPGGAVTLILKVVGAKFWNQLPGSESLNGQDQARFSFELSTLPALSITADSLGGLRLSWPNRFGAFQVQSTRTPATPGSWIPFKGQVIPLDDTNVVDIQPSASSGFFRLITP